MSRAIDNQNSLYSIKNDRNKEVLMNSTSGFHSGFQELNVKNVTHMDDHCSKDSLCVFFSYSGCY